MDWKFIASVRRNILKPKVYKSKVNFTEVCDFFDEKGYQKIGETKVFKDKQIKISLFFDVHSKEIPEWVNELLIFFNSVNKFATEIPNQYNAIVVIETKKNIFLLPKGHAFWAVENISDLEFGLNFAEKAMRSKDITMKSVSYVQRNKMRGITNYKYAQNEFPQASESYFYVSGKPEAEQFFGSNIDCGTAINFAENYNLTDTNSLEKFCDLFNQIDITLGLKGKKATIPRMHKVSKKNELYSELNNRLLNDLKSENQNSNLLFNINRIQLINNSVEILENEKYLGIYLSNKKRETEQLIDLDISKITSFIHEYDSFVTDIQQIRFALYDANGAPIKANVSIFQLIYCEIEIDGRIYVLDNGNWCYFNDRFYILLEEKMNQINDIVNFSEGFSIEYDSFESGELAGEGGYIEVLSKNPQMVKLHKRNLAVSGNTIEVADIYDKNKDELLAIKRGTSTSLAMYSFEQSLLSVQVLANKNEFNVKKELLKYNDRSKYKDKKKYPNIREGVVDKIIECKDTSVLWLINDSPKYIFENVIRGTFCLNDFKSLMLKLKIVDWYLFTKDNGFNPKLYFAIDKPRKNVDEVI